MRYLYYLFYVRRVLHRLDGVRCFAADSFVSLTDGQQKKIGELQSGDKVLAYDDKTKEVISTHVITMLDNQPNQFGNFSCLS